MKKLLEKLDKYSFQIIKRIGLVSQQKGVQTYLVGGVVRDILLKQKNLDLDFVVEGDAVVLARAFAKKDHLKIVVHQAFKTATVDLKNGLRLDFATARKEVYLKGGSLPRVSKGVLKDDLFRRDFTINAMAIAINPECYGTLIDFWQGREDLLKKRIRIMHEKSFIDDPTRILRAVRFERRLNFKMERQTVVLLKEAVAKKCFQTIKPARYFNEYRKMLRERDPLKALKRFSKLNGFSYFSTRYQMNTRLMNALHERIMRLRKSALYKDFKEVWMLYCVGLFESMSPSMLKEVLARFPFTREERRALEQVFQVDSLCQKLSKKNNRRSDVYSICHALPPFIVIYLRVRTAKKDIAKVIDWYIEKDKDVRLHLTGHDLQKIGAVSGKEVGVLLNRLLLMKIDQCVRTRTDELSAVKGLILSRK